MISNFGECVVSNKPPSGLSKNANRSFKVPWYCYLYVIIVVTSKKAKRKRKK